jgi:hypothetical protein
MLSRPVEVLKRLKNGIGLAYVRVPSVHGEFVRPFARRDSATLSTIGVPVIRVPKVELKVYRPFH